MKDWLGILIFVGIAIANIMVEQNRKKKKKAARTAPAVPLSPAGNRLAQQDAISPIRSEAPVKKEPTLQETLQRLFEASQSKPAPPPPPPLPHKAEVVMAQPPPRPVTQSRNTAMPAQASVPATPLQQPAASSTVTPAQAVPVPPPPATVVNRSSENWLSKANFRSTSALRRAVIMSEILAKPKALQ